MNTLIDKLKNDTFSGVFELSGKAWLPTLISYVVYSILVMLLFIPIILNLMNISMEDFARLQDIGNDPVAMSRQMEGMAENFATNITTVSFGLILLGVLGALLLSAWTYYVAFLSSKAVIDEDKVDVGKILTNSFSMQVLKLFLAFLAIMIVSSVGFILITIIAGFLTTMSPALSVLLAFVASLAWIAFHWRLSLSMPIVAYEDVSIGEAFSISLNSISWSKAFKYTLLSFLGIIVMVIIGLVMALIAGLLGALPIVGVILGPVINMIISAFFLTLIVATLVALYYKYRGGDLTGNNKIEDHLLYDN